MKDKKVKNIQSIYIPQDKIPVIEALDVIRWREHRTMSDIILEAMKEYANNHKDGNTQYFIDDPVYATPAFFRDNETWKVHFDKLLKNEENNYKFKLQELNHLFYKRFGYRPYE